MGRVVRRRLRETRWLCKNCGAECRGRDETCHGDDGQSGCGHSKPEGVKDYLPENSPYLTDPALIADARSGADWHCDHCSGANKGSVGGHPVVSCVHCGNGRDEQDRENAVRDVTGQVLRTAEAATAAEREEKNAAARERRESRMPPQMRRAVPDMPEARGSARPPLGMIAAFAVLAIAALFLVWSLAFARYEVTWKVEEHRWSRNIVTEAYRTLEDEGWDPPADARITDTERRIRTYRDVLVGYEPKTRIVTDKVEYGTEEYDCGTTDLGNGYFEDKICERPTYKEVQTTEHYKEPVYEEEPVYDTWHEWEVDRWVRDRSWPTSGAGTDRAWADLPPMRRDLREAGRSEKTWMVLRGAEGTRDWSVTEPVWLSTRDGAEIVTETDYWGRILRARGADGAAIDFRP